MVVVEGDTTIFFFLFLYSLNSVRRSQIIDPQEQTKDG